MNVAFADVFVRRVFEVYTALKNGGEKLRSNSQIIGEIGEYFVCYQIVRNRVWVPRLQTHDYGIDIEAELTEPEIKGHAVKVQVKSSETIENTDFQYVNIRLKKSYLMKYKDNNQPVILVAVDVNSEKAYYMYLQKWIYENLELLLTDTPQSIVMNIPRSNTLQNGLGYEWKKIAMKETRFQKKQFLKIAESIASNIEGLELPGEETISSIEEIIDRMLELGLRIWATDEGNVVAFRIYELCREFGNLFSKDSIVSLAIQQNGYSRTGLAALGILYDEYYSYISNLKLPDAFIDYQHLRYYCLLRERYPNTSGIMLFLGKNQIIDWNIEGIGLSQDSVDLLIQTYPNRGPSIIFDYLEPL